MKNQELKNKILETKNPENWFEVKKFFFEENVLNLSLYEGMVELYGETEEINILILIIFQNLVGSYWSNTSEFVQELVKEKGVLMVYAAKNQLELVNSIDLIKKLINQVDYEDWVTLLETIESGIKEFKNVEFLIKNLMIFDKI